MKWIVFIAYPFIYIIAMVSSKIINKMLHTSLYVIVVMATIFSFIQASKQKI